MLEPSSEDISLICGFVSPDFFIRAEISSRLGSDNLRGIRGMQQESPGQAGSREGNTRALWVTATSQGGFHCKPKFSQGWECPNKTSAGPGRVRPGPATQGCGGSRVIREHLEQSGYTRFTAAPAAWLHTPQQGCVTCTNPLFVCLSIHPSLWTTQISLQAWECQSTYSKNILTLTSIPLRDTASPKLFSFHRGPRSASPVTQL